MQVEKRKSAVAELCQAQVKLGWSCIWLGCAGYVVGSEVYVVVAAQAMWWLYTVIIRHNSAQI